MPSTVIAAFDYDAVAHRLDVEFVSGRRYIYFAVPEQEAAGLKIATSKGGYFNRRIRDRYRFRRS